MHHTYLITGGAGFIGSHCVDQLVARNERVVVLDKLPVSEAKNLELSKKHITYLEGDIRDREAVDRAMEKVTHVLHLAALVSVPVSLKEPQLTHEVNLTGTVNVLESARACGATRVVLASSAAVYGNTDQIPTSEDVPQHPCSPYGFSKQAGEGYMRLYRDAYGLSTTSLRFFNVYGSRQDPHSPYSGVISIFMNQMRRGVAPTIFGDGMATRDFIHVSDVARTCIASLDAQTLPRDAYNVGRGIRVSLNELVDTLNQVLDTQVSPSYAPEREGDIVHSGAAIDALVDIIDMTKARTLADGLREMLCESLVAESEQSGILPNV